MRKRMIAGNWKMNMTYSEAVTLAQNISIELGQETGDVEVVVCPPAVDLKGVQGVIDFDRAQFALGAQNVYWEEKGAYTGETSVDMLINVGCRFCIIGHSERRGYFGETDEDINKKAQALIAKHIVPILCCGESLEIRGAGNQVEFVVEQIKNATAGLKLASANDLVIAYEPIWAIGTGKTATPEDAEEVCAAIRKQLAAEFGNLADGIRILYGGSASPANIAMFLHKDSIDGALVGGASLKADSFVSMVRTAETC